MTSTTSSYYSQDASEIEQDAIHSKAYNHDAKPGTHSKVPTNAKEANDSLHQDVLMQVHRTFLEADGDGSGRLAPDEFIRAFIGILQTEDGADEEALSKLFCRIDANSDGTIDWDEFSSYMLLESTGAASIRELECGVSFVKPEAPPVPENLVHKDIITHLSHVTMPNGADRYVSCGKDGVVKVWNAKDLSHMRSIPTGKSWVTCAKMLPLTGKLAVSSFSRAMKIYDMQTYELCGSILELEYAPMAMDVWVPPNKKAVEMVVFGDGGGCVRLYEIRINPLEDKNSSDRYLDTQKWQFQHHSDWVTCVKYVEDMSCVIAGSLDKFISMTDAEERVPLKVLEGHTKGVTSVDWSPIYKFVCSGGQDKKVILWNPFSQKPIAQLVGHTSGVQQVLVNDRDNQIISLGADKTVKVWDIRNHQCLQTIQDREHYKAEDTLLSMAFDLRRKQLVTGNVRPKAWRQVVTTSGSAGHREPVSKVIYNSMFAEAVSGDHGGTVSVWHVPTGKLRFRFYNAHGDKRITAMSFDSAKRRLITGSEGGDVKVWNFSSGSCLMRLKPRSHEEVTSVLAVRGLLLKHFLVAGWDRQVTFFDDAPVPEVGPGRSLKGHKSDILDVALMEGFPGLVTACDDGEIWSWNIDSGAPRRVMTPRFRADVAPNEQAAEAVRFLHGKWSHILVSVYADRFLRLWDVHAGRCLLETFTGHKVGETVVGLAVHPSDQRIATADSAGFIKVWDTSTLLLHQTGGSPLVGEVRITGELSELCVWRGHKKQVSALDWAEGPDAGRFLLSSSHDHDVKLWSEDGALVGVFGEGQWRLEDPGTWQAQDIKPLEEVEAFDMRMSAKRPDQWGAYGMASTAALAREYSFMRQPLPDDEEEEWQAELAAAAEQLPSPVGALALPPRSTAASAARASSCFKSGLGGPYSRPSSCRPPASPASMVGRARPSTATAAGGLMSRSSHVASAVPARQTIAAVGANSSSGSSGAARSSMAAGAAAAAAGSMSRNSRVWSASPGVAAAGGDSAGGGGGSTAFRRPASASCTAGVAKVLQASHRERLARLGSARHFERDASMVGGGTSSRVSAYSRQGSAYTAGSHSNNASRSLGPASSRFGSLASYEEGGVGSLGEEDEDVLESESSSDHDNDRDVPPSLWLEEFEATRKNRRPDAPAEQPRRAIYTPPGGQNLNFPNVVGRKDGGVAHLMHVSELSSLPQRPATAYKR